jgi:predicted secreted protein
VGDELEIQLEEVGSSGFTWHHEPTDGLSLVREGVTADRGAPPGSPATHRFNFRVEAPGNLELRLSKARPWARAQPSRTLHFRLTAAGPAAPPNP